MSINTPRVALRVTFDEDDDYIGEMTTMSLGYGLHQAWVFATMFASTTLLDAEYSFPGALGDVVTVPSTLSMLVFGLCLVLYACLDKYLIPIVIDRRIFVGSAVLMCVGTLLLFLPNGSENAVTITDILFGIFTGVGSASMVLGWGCCYAREDVLTISINSGIALVFGFFIYGGIIVPLSYPAGGIVVAFLPLLELLFYFHCDNKTRPAPSEGYIFHSLPIGKGSFAFRYGFPILVFGIALGLMRRVSLQSFLSEPAGHAQTVLVAVGIAIIVYCVIAILTARSDSIRRYFRILVPIIAAAILFIPTVNNQNLGNLQMAFPLAAYICFEALMWSFFGEASQSYRLSPIMCFGFGRGFLALGSTVAAIVTVLCEIYLDSLPLGSLSILMLMLIIMVCAYAALPGDRDFAQMTQINKSAYANKPANSAMSKEARDLTRTNDGETDDATMVPVEKTDDNSDVSRSDATVTSEPFTPQQSVAIPTDSPLATNVTDWDRLNRGWFRARCGKVADTYLLSERESEVMFYLAKGYNAAYVQQQLYISEGTAKTHMRHIYRKMDIHSQQELMRMVENAKVDRPILD